MAIESELGIRYTSLVQFFEMDVKLARLVGVGRLLAASEVNEDIRQFNREVNRLVLDVMGRHIDRIHTTIEQEERRRRQPISHSYLVTTIHVMSTVIQLNYRLRYLGGDRWRDLISVILGPDAQSSELRGGPTYYATGAFNASRYEWQNQSVRATEASVRELASFAREYNGKFIEFASKSNSPTPILKECSECKKREADLGSKWCKWCFGKLQPLKDAVHWLVFVITTVANAQALGMAAGLSMSPLFIAATKKGIFDHYVIWQERIISIRTIWGVCVRHGLIVTNSIRNCQHCTNEKARLEQLELVMQWLDKVCRVAMKLVWEQVDSSFGRSLLLETHDSQVVAEDEHDNTRYALLELS